MFTYLSHLECSACSKTFDPSTIVNLCECGAPIMPRYNLKAAASAVCKNDLRGCTLWRYHAVLPVQSECGIVTLGEGGTPLLRVDRLGAQLGLSNLSVKDESVNPTGSFKARGLSMAISRAKELGVKKAAIPSAGNAGGAASAYCARAGIELFVFMPKDVPRAFITECEMNGAKVTLVDGLISDCGKIVGAGKAEHGWFELSTLKEPYRVEGKKTLGYELAEQRNWVLPDVILYPTGGGTGLVGMWKAFDEMEAMGWIGSKRPRMVSVQAEGCAPIVRAFHSGAEKAEPWVNASTKAAGLRVPGAVADFLMLKALRDSGGTAVAVSDEELLTEVKTIGCAEGMFVCPEGGAVIAALRKLIAEDWIGRDEQVVLFNTGSGLKYLDAFNG